MFSCLLRSNCISPVSTNSSPICTPTAHRSTFCSPCLLVPAKFLSCFSDGCVWITSHHLKLTWLKNPFRMSTEALLSAFFLRAGDISNILSHIWDYGYVVLPACGLAVGPPICSVFKVCKLFLTKKQPSAWSMWHGAIWSYLNWLWFLVVLEPVYQKSCMSCCLFMESGPQKTTCCHG